MAGGGRRGGGRPGHRQRVVQQLVGGQREAELRRRAQDAGRAALPERAEALLRHDLARAVRQPRVRGLALARLHLQPRFDHVARRRQVRGRHARDRARRQQLQHAELLGWRLAEQVLLQMRVRREVDGGEGDCGGELARVRHNTQTNLARSTYCRGGGTRSRPCTSQAGPDSS